MVYEIIIGFVVAFVLFWLRDIHLFKKRTKRQLEMDLIKNKLEKLYTPLYVLIKSAEWLTDKSILGIQKMSGEPDDFRQKKILDDIIQKHLYLANDELHELLPRAFGAGQYKNQKEEDLKKIVDLIKKEYEDLQKEYMKCE